MRLLIIINILSFSFEIMATENTCFILGASGETGQSLLKNLVENCTKYEKIILLNRRHINYDELFKNHSRVDIEQRIIDFRCLDKHMTDFTGGKTVFCCIGSSLSKASKVLI